MSNDITAAFEGLDPSLLEAITKPEVLEKLNAYVEKAKEPVLSNKNEVLGKYTTLNDTIKQLGGIETLKNLKAAADAAERDKQEALAKSGNVDALRKQFETALAEKDTQLNELQSSIVKEKSDSAIRRALREADADADLLFPHVASRVKSELKDGKVVLTALDKNGQPLTTKDLKEGSIKDLVEEYKAAFPSAFKAKGTTGTGAKSGAAAQGVVNPWMEATRSYSEQMRVIRDDPGLATQLAALAGKTLKLS